MAKGTASLCVSQPSAASLQAGRKAARDAEAYGTQLGREWLPYV